MQNDGSISPVQAFFRNKWVRLILIVDVIAVIVVIGFLIWNATKTAIINFSVAPLDAKIQIDGHGEYSNGSYNVHPGNHTITISHDGLTTKTFDLDLQSGYSTTITTFLSDNGNFDFYELKDNYGSFQKLAAIASAGDNLTTDHDTSAEQFIASLEHTLSILEILPIIGHIDANPEAGTFLAGFAIHDGENKAECEKTACLLVNYYGINYETAVTEAIKNTGYNPTDYQLVYERYN